MIRFFKVVLAVLAVVVVVLALVLWRAPHMLAASAPDYLTKAIGPYLVIEDAYFIHSPPEMVFEKIHLKNPKAFGGGDAMQIDRINVTFKSRAISPMQIDAVTLHGVRGEFRMREGVTNFDVMLKVLMDKKSDTPRGFLARKAELGRVAMHRTSIQNEGGGNVVALEDVELNPTGRMKDPVTLQHIITDVLGAAIVHEKGAVGYLAVENIKDKTRKAVKSIGEAVKDFLSTP